MCFCFTFLVIFFSVRKAGRVVLICRDTFERNSVSYRIAATTLERITDWSERGDGLEYGRFQGVQRCQTCSNMPSYQWKNKKKQSYFYKLFLTSGKHHYANHVTQLREIAILLRDYKQPSPTSLCFTYLQQHLSITSEVLLDLKKNNKTKPSILCYIFSDRDLTLYMFVV